MNTLADSFGIPKTQEALLIDILNTIKYIPLHWSPAGETKIEDAHLMWSAYVQRLQELKLIPPEYGK
jgi:hypothetical protein